VQISAVSASSSGPMSRSAPRPAGTALSSQQAPYGGTDVPTDPSPPQRTPAVPHLTTSDRAAVAGATGVYISPDGEITPPSAALSWASISRYVQQRHRQVDAAAVAAAYNIPVGDGLTRLYLQL
jgi:hypothetical protein